jgi:hypothetical protein
MAGNAELSVKFRRIFGQFLRRSGRSRLGGQRNGRAKEAGPKAERRGKD